MSEEAQTEEIPNSTRDLEIDDEKELMICLLYTSPSPRDS